MSSLRQVFLNTASCDVRRVVVGLYGIIIALLSLIFVFGAVVKGGQNRFDLGLFAFHAADLAKLILVIFLAKYLRDDM